LFGGNGGLLGFSIGNPKYPAGLESLGGLGGLGGHDPPPPGFNGFPTKIKSTSLGISVCMLTRFVPLKVCGLNFILGMVWASVVINGASIIVTIE